MKYIIIVFALVIVLSPVSFSGYGNNKQQITDFYLSNFKTDGSSDWEIKGKEAIVEGDYIDIESMDANYYLEKDTISVQSNKARLNKKSQDVQLNGDVNVENKKGWNLKTDYLDWQRNKNYIKTDSVVRTRKDSFFVKAKGLHADTQLKKADFKKDVSVTFTDKKTKDATTINCDGPLEIEYNSGKATFKNNVVVNHKQGKLFSDIAILFFDTENKEITKIISKGHVKIIRDDNVTLAEKATYLAKEQKLILEGSPQLIYFPKEGEEGSSGFLGVN